MRRLILLLAGALSLGAQVQNTAPQTIGDTTPYASLGTASSYSGRWRTVTDCNSATNCTAGGGSAYVPFFSNGTSWQQAGPSTPLGTGSMISILNPSQSGFASACSGSANQVMVWLWTVQNTITVTNVAWSIETVKGSSGTGKIGIYSTAGALLAESSALQTNTANGQSATLAYTLTPGPYYIARACDDTTTTIDGQAAQSDWLDGYQVLSTLPVVGTAANAMSGGNLPATLGTVTEAGSFVPDFKFINQ